MRNIGRARNSLVLAIWLIVLAISVPARAERWSRQVSNSEWIPLANPRNRQGHNQNLGAQVLPQVHQPLIPASLPPELRQEYQQQLLQLQKTQESIQRLLLLQQQLKAQQNLLQNQAFAPNGLPESEENKQALHQSAIANAQTLPGLVPEVLVPPQLSEQPNPPVYTSQNFHEPQGEDIRQEQYEDYSDRQPSDYRNPERVREELREEDKYVPEAPTGQGSEGENGDDGEEEVQVVYVPAETLAQRGHAKNQQRERDRKHFGNQDTRQHRTRPYTHQQESLESSGRQRENDHTTVSPEDDAYAREFLQQLQREHEGTDRLLKEAREKELARLREERKEIQRRAKLQQAAVQREQEIQRQREAEKKQKELARLEEAAKQRELERIREARERQRFEEMERSKKAQARINEEKRKQEEARLAEIERLAMLERQKKAEIDKTIAAQRDLERIQKEEEERAKEAERSHLARQKELSKTRQETEASPQAQPLIRNHHNHQQHLGQSGKYNRHGRIRNKPRQRQQHQNAENSQKIVHETTTITPPSPNQPPLAVYMSKPVDDTRVIRITDVLKTLKGAQTIDVLDSVGQNSPQVFVGPSNLEVPESYVKFDLPYLSSIDNNRVERRVDKLPFFVAPLSFNPPPGYSKIPFPAPHIGSVVINNLDSNISITQPDGSLEEVNKSQLSPLIEPNSFSEDNSQGQSYSTRFDSSSTPSYANVRHEEPSSTAQYQTSPSYATVGASGPGSNYRFRQPFDAGNPSGPQEQSKLNYQDQIQQRPAYQEQSHLPLAQENPPQYSDDSARSTTPIYRRPNVVTSFAYQESPQPVPSSTPIYEESYSNIRDDSSNGPANSQLTSANADPPQHRQVVNRYQLTDQRKDQRGQEYSNVQVDPEPVRYEDSPTGPTQYNLPAELPPIHPQLPGLVNSLLDENEETAFINKEPSLPTTTSTTTVRTTTTAHVPLTTHRTRGRQRGRVVATRPTTTTTPAPSSSAKSRDTDRTRRPFGRTRSRYTTTTEEYRETYEPTKAKASPTTPRYTSQENYRRPASSKSQKYKSRETDDNLHASRSQVQDVQAHEAANSRNSPWDQNPRQPENTATDSNAPVYSQYDFASATTSRENYPAPETDGSQIPSTTGQVEYSKDPIPRRSKPAALSSLQDQEELISQQFQERYPTADFSQSGLDEAPVNGFNYQIRNENTPTTPAIPPSSKDFSYYQNNQEAFDSSHLPLVSTNAPFKSRINDYQLPPQYESSGFRTGDQNSGFRGNDDGLYDPYSQDVGAPAAAREPAPQELTTEAPTTTTTTTTEAAPVIIRQRVRARLGGRGRPEAVVQTKSRGSQDEYVRFSAVNNQNTPTTERPTSRNRENHRTKPKSRQQHQGVQIQTEGNDYVRIQSPIRTFQKTIVTPPSTSSRTTTTQVPITTTEYESSNDEVEYGFIRPPNFAPVQPAENQYQTPYRLGDNQAQLQSIVATDETAADSVPNHAQVSRNRPKYQSPNRRPANKVVTSTSLTSENSPYTERPRTRIEEPKNNRIRVRGRKPGRRRTTTTTTTTTEYILEENNDLPLEENYPRPLKTLEDLGDRQEFYNEKLEALPLGAGSLANSAQHSQSSFTSQDFMLNFGSEPDHLLNPEIDQTQLASEATRKYGNPSGTRSRSHQHNRDNQERDIYGSESQWSTKLTSASFQPSANVNGLGDNDRKTLNHIERKKSSYSKDVASADAPEVITAPPEEAYVTIMVSSDEVPKKSATSPADTSIETSPMEDTNFGMKTGFENQQNFVENTTPTPKRTAFESNSNGTVVNSEEGTSGSPGQVNQPPRRVGGRRRRVRVRVRPAASDDFVTAESQHFNSAVNNLLQSRLKYRRRPEESRGAVTTTLPPNYDDYTSTLPPEKSIFEDLLKEVFAAENKSSSADSEVTTPSQSSPEPSEVPQDQLNTVSQVQEYTTEPEVSRSPEVLSEQSNVVVNRSDEVSVAPNQSEVIGTSGNSSANASTAEEATNSTGESSSNANEPDSSTDTPLMTTMTVPRKSWDSTSPYRDSAALNNGEDLSYSEKNSENELFDENAKGPDNRIIDSDYRAETAKNEDNLLSANNEEENYPKNHRSEWSEVRYPTSPELLNYNRRPNATTSPHLPGSSTESGGDAGVKTLSDYVKAIFDSMKNAEEQKSENETFSRGDSTSPGDERVSSSTSYSPGTSEDSESVPTTIPSSSDYPTEKVEISEDSSVKLASNSSESESEGKDEDPTVGNTENPVENDTEEFTEPPQSTEIVETTKYVEETTEVSTEASSSETSNSFTISQPSEASAMTDSANPIDHKTTAATESSPQAKNSSETKLGAILRTSTTTKVSHMTEICYRGRCVMTKPKKEVYAR
ncbi:mucin-5AC [Venturia canescens]|uniref:mucin-5AC n=1 Tax=Venturia canescens TaxID=32260 RepID=UPI001C9C8456|nr:mucin-5AC [Venturia canescens]